MNTCVYSVVDLYLVDDNRLVINTYFISFQDCTFKKTWL